MLFLNSNPTNGTLHLNAPTDTTRSNWIALYDANCTDLIDSVTVPSLAPDMSYARIAVDGGTWVIRSREKVTPGIDNSFKTAESKISKWKREDPHGLALSFLSMGFVFSCLALLYVFFRLSGTYMEQKMRIKAATENPPSLMALQKAGQIMADTGHKTNVILKDGLKTKGIDKEIYVALIAMALKEYLEDVHDVESDIITIKGKHTNWNNLTRLHTMAKYQYRVQGIDYNVDIVSVEGNIAKVSVNGIDFEVEMMKPAKTVKKTVVVAVPKPTGPALTDVVTDMKRDTGVRTASPASGTPVLAPLPGTITAVNVKLGQHVSKGETVVVLEAMKMQNNIEAEVDGVVTSIPVSQGESVMEGNVLVTIG